MKKAMNLSTKLREFLRNNSIVGLPLRAAYARWLNCIAEKDGLAWSVNGEEIRIHPKVRHFVPRVVETELFDYLRNNLLPGQTVLDVGSFLGVYAILEARWVGPGGKVIALEPTPGMATFIRSHIRYNGMQERIHLIEAAAGKEEGIARFATYEEPYRNAVVPGPALIASNSHISVPIVTLDRLCEEHKLLPDWIRMDVQGFEWQVLQGAKQVLATGRGRLRIVAEMHPQLWPQLGITLEEVEDNLAALGLSCESLIPGQSPFVPDGHAILQSI